VPPPLPAIGRFSYLVRPVNTGRPGQPGNRFFGKATYGRAIIPPPPSPAVPRFSYIHKPVFTGRPLWKVTIGGLPVIRPLPVPKIKNLDLIARDPKIDSRDRRAIDTLSIVHNSLTRQGILVKTGPLEWTINSGT